MNAVGIIPARHASSRFPGKPLAVVAGRPMIQRVWEGARSAKHLREVYVATDDERIAHCCEAFGAPVIMTSDVHPTGTDRVAEAAAALHDDVIVNIQGDEPLITGFVVDSVVTSLLEDDAVGMSTLVQAAGAADIDDPNRVKVVLDRHGRALYFSRAPIPHSHRTGPAASYWHHIGIYAYRRDFLLRFVELPQTAAERSEALEQLRALEHGLPIRVGVIEGFRSVAVDVPADIQRAEALLKERDRDRSAK